MSKSRTELASVWPPTADVAREAGHKLVSPLKASRERWDTRHEQFIEIIETETTRDQPFADRDGSWGTRSTPPSGDGWRVVDALRDRHTEWQRRRPVALRRLWGRKC